MKQSVIAMTLLATASAPAFAGGIERRGDPSQIMFEEGRNYVEFSVTSVDPDVSGDSTVPPTLGTFSSTGDIQDRYQNYALGYKHQLNDRFALAFVIDEPVGADVTYRGPDAFGGGPFFGTSTASVESVRYTGMAKYKATERFSVYGGLSYVGLSGSLDVFSPTTGGVAPPGATPPNPGTGTVGTYSLAVNKDFQLGYMLGAAYEVPDIALRVALTYESETEHEFDDTTGSPFEVKLPQSLTLHAQSGIAKNTLLFGSVRWREWSEFQVAPTDFLRFSPNPQVPPATTPIAFGTEDIYTYRLGIGRRLNENWSGAFILGYEEQTGNQVGNLEGTDGFFSYTAAVTHTMERLEVTGALSYVDIQDADTSVASFSDNDAIAFGLKVGMKF